MEVINIDRRIRKVIKRSVASNHRSLFFIYGTDIQKNVAYLHHMLMKIRLKLKLKEPSILWCYKDDKIFRRSAHKRIKCLKKKYSEGHTISDDDVFEHFLVSSNFQSCHYGDTSRILGQTFGMLVLQDFASLTPNIMARLVECVEGGGVVIFLLNGICSMQELASIHMDVHSHYATESHPKVFPNFNTRLLLSLPSCSNCLVLDEDYNITMAPEYQNKPDLMNNLNDVKQDLSSNPSVTNLCCTEDQRRTLNALIECIQSRDIRHIVSLTSGRGRGKSATLGLAICHAVSLGYTNIYVTSPHIENVQSLFTFAIRGFNLSGLIENTDYSVSCTTINCFSYFKEVIVHQQNTRTISYMPPTEFYRIGNADLVVVDEAAAIPLPIVKKWLNNSTVFMASTVNGYEGTGRSLSLKLLSQLRSASCEAPSSSHKSFKLHEIELHQAIRYSNGDPVEEWLNNLLCLDAKVLPYLSAPPSVENSELFYVNKDVLFCGEAKAEHMLQQMMSLFVTSHYKNSPNDLLMIADAPAHHLFCLLPPADSDLTVLCAIQVAFEGGLSKETFRNVGLHGKDGDLIPWTVAHQFQNEDFPTLKGARIVRIATHPDLQKMGYGLHSIKKLCSYFAQDPPCSKTSILQESPLFLRLDEKPQEQLHYIGVSYGMNPELLSFWKKSGFLPVYLRQTSSPVTGEYSCIMIRGLCDNEFHEFHHDFCNRLVSLLPSVFRSLPASLAVSLLRLSHNHNTEISPRMINWMLPVRSMERLSLFCKHRVDLRLILDLIPNLCRLLFTGGLKLLLSYPQECVLVGVGLQAKDAEEVALSLNLEFQQTLDLFRKSVSRMLSRLKTLQNLSDGNDKKANQIMENFNFSNNKNKKLKRKLCIPKRFKKKLRTEK